MTIADSLNASNAYQNISRQIEGIAGGDKDETGEASGSGGDFMGMVKSAAEKSIDTLKAGDTQAAKAVTGETTLPQLIEAVSAAEMTLQTTVAVRDRMISAYQEIMRMPI